MNKKNWSTAYFESTTNYFWRWAQEEGTGSLVVETTVPAITICYWEELLNDLQSMTGHLPPLSVLLMTMAIGKTDEEHATTHFTRESVQLHLLRPIMRRDTWSELLPLEELKELTATITSFVQRLHALPRRYWQGDERHLLFKTLFACTPAEMSPKEAHEMLTMFRETGMLPSLNKRAEEYKIEQARTDAGFLKMILEQYPDSDALEKALKAAIMPPPPPSPAPIEVPEKLPLPADAKELSLLQLLAEDDRTAYIALLTQRLLAALHLPAHMPHAGDITVGGVADITNKGTIDRLLISELANEDDVLMARLANNEAMYLRREEVPDNEPPHRYILIDKSIRMWGTPHILAIATGLACALDNKRAAAIHAFALTGDTFQPIDLTEKDDIVRTMHRLSPALNSAAALTAFNMTHPLTMSDEYFLITSEELFNQPAFQQAFAALRTVNGFLITVSREADVLVYRYMSGHRKLLRTSKINLDPPKALPKKAPAKDAFRGTPTVMDVPKFLRHTPLPLLMAAGSLYRHSNRSASGQEGYLALTKQRQLVFWPDRKKGGSEIMSLFPEAYAEKYYFGYTGAHYVFSFQEKHSRNIKLYQFSPETLELIEIPVNMTLPATPERLFDDLYDTRTHQFIFTRNRWKTDLVTLDVYSGLLAADQTRTWEAVKKELDEEKRKANLKYYVPPPVAPQYFKFISALKSIKINKKGNLVINGKHELTFVPNNMAFVLTHGPVEAPDIVLTAEKLKLKDLRPPLLRYNWPDGSELWFDKARHMLYLRSSDKAIPEMAIPLVIQTQTACWASDGVICGNPYFRPKEVEVITVMDFHEKYFRPFINVIQQYATAAAT